MREDINPLIKFCGTRTDPDAETKSIGLPADALVPRFLLAIWTILSRPETHNPYPDLLPFNNFTVTLGYSSVYRDWQKTRHPDTDANSIKPPGR
jgi:hypothetical protein